MQNFNWTWLLANWANISYVYVGNIGSLCKESQCCKTIRKIFIFSCTNTPTLIGNKLHLRNFWKEVDPLTASKLSFGLGVFFAEKKKKTDGCRICNFRKLFYFYLVVTQNVGASFKVLAVSTFLAVLDLDVQVYIDVNQAQSILWGCQSSH